MYQNWIVSKLLTEECISVHNSGAYSNVGMYSGYHRYSKVTAHEAIRGIYTVNNFRAYSGDVPIPTS